VKGNARRDGAGEQVIGQRPTQDRKKGLTAKSGPGPSG